MRYVTQFFILPKGCTIQFLNCSLFQFEFFTVQQIIVMGKVTGDMFYFIYSDSSQVPIPFFFAKVTFRVLYHCTHEFIL